MISLAPHRPHQTKSLDGLRDARVAGALATGAGFLGAMAHGSEGEDSPAKQLQDQRAILADQQQQAYQRREAQRASGEGPQFRAADAEWHAIGAKIDSIDAQLKAYANSPEHQQDIAARAAQLKAEEDARWAHTPFRERYPGVAGALPAAGLVLSGTLPGAVGIGGKLATRTEGSLAGRFTNALADARAAIASGGDAGRDYSRRYLDNLVAEARGPYATAVKATAKTLGVGAAGGSLTAEAGMFPDQYDAFNLPPGDEQQKAQARALEPTNYLHRAATGSLTGMSAYKFGNWLTPGRKPDIAAARALADTLREGPTLRRPPSQTWGPGHPNYREQGPGGRFLPSK